MAMPREREALSFGRLLLLGCLLLHQTTAFVRLPNRHRIRDEKPLTFTEDLTWKGFPELVQVSAVAVDKFKNVHIFHRADRIWDFNTFTNDDMLRHPEQGPILNDTVLVVDPDSGKVIYSWGDNLFYMPHGLFIDDKGNSWVTDVGLHQVFKFPYRESTPTIVLGSALKPGVGKNRFCKPTDVAVLKSEFFFVSDGYCNSRIVMFSPSGAFIKEIGSKDGMTVPHSLTLFNQETAVCVADRENGRIFCYSTGMEEIAPGLRLKRIESKYLTRVFGVATRGDKLLAVNGEDLPYYGKHEASQHGVVVDPFTGEVGNIWGPKNGFASPHNMAVSPDGKCVYIVEIEPTEAKKVYRFHID